MKVIILAAGQGTRLRPLTNDRPKCMVEINGKSIIARQIDTIKSCGIDEQDIYIIAGYRGDQLRKYFANTRVNIIENKNYETTNMVASLMCARTLMEQENDVIVSYGDIVYNEEVFNRILTAQNDISVIVDNGWYGYWAERCENPLDDAETLMMDANKNLIEIGQKTNDIAKVQSQYIGLMRYQGQGLKKVLNICSEAEERSKNGMNLWRTERTYNNMYMTDMLQGLIDEGNILKAVEIQRGWYEVDDPDDLSLVEKELK